MLTHSQDFGTVYTLMLADGEGYALLESIFSRPIPLKGVQEQKTRDVFPDNSYPARTSPQGTLVIHTPRSQRVLPLQSFVLSGQGVEADHVIGTGLQPLSVFHSVLRVRSLCVILRMSQPTLFLRWFVVRTSSVLYAA
jgi:hypothetical protein